MLKNKNKIFIFIILVFISSCQKVEILDPIVFDYNQFTKVSINAEKKNTIILYEPKFVEPFIDHSLENSPYYILTTGLKIIYKLLVRKIILKLML